MSGAGPYHALVKALHVLIRTAGVAQGYASAERVAAECAGALAEVLVGENHFVLQERAGSFHANGHRLRPAVDLLPALETLGEVFQRLSLSDLLFTPEARQADLRQFAHLASRLPEEGIVRALDRLGVRGIEVGLSEVNRDGPRALLASSVSPRINSILRSVFLQSRLISALNHDGPVPGRLAKAVLSAVVDRLLQQPDGMEPLLVLQEDAGLLAHAVNSCVVAAVLARWLGCPEHILSEVAAAGMLRCLGGLVQCADSEFECGDPGEQEARAAAAAFQWFLRKGGDDLWLRCAIVSRLVPRARGTTLAAAASAASLAATVVRIADRFVALHTSTGGVRNAVKAMRREATSSQMPTDGIDALNAVLRACVAVPA